jgi:hypothetical protein
LMRCGLSLLAALHPLVKCLACLLGLVLTVIAVYAASCGYSGFRVKLPPAFTPWQAGTG